jgi:surface protein
MDYMFSGCSYLKELYLDNWNINQVVTMNYLFSGCSSLISVNLASFNSPNLKSIRGMFYSCYSLQSLNLTNFNTKKVTNMDYLFYKAFELKIINFTKKEYRLESSNLTNTPTSYFNTSLVESMRYMFAFCSKLEFLDLSFFNTSKVKDMSYMFKNCSKLTSLNLSSFGTNNVKSMDSMFFNCLNLSYINLLNIHDAEVDNINNILDETPKHMVVCIIENNAPKIYGIITNTKGGCFSIYCGSDYLEHRKKLIMDDKGNSINKCTSLCKTEGGMFDYHFNCYKTCPEGTFPDDNEKADDYFCVPPELKPEKCTLQRVFLE